MFFKRKNKNTSKNIINVQWGGYYSSKGEEGYGLFRLLDLNSRAYHIQLFKEKFDHSPTFEEIQDLRPFVRHVPLDLQDLLSRTELALIGHKELDSDALQGYEEYLRQMGGEEKALLELLNNLQEFSKQGVQKLKLQKNYDQVVIVPVE